MFQIGESVVFGRESGESTRGVIVKINAKTVGVRQDEPRGRYPVGTVWRVDPQLITRADGSPKAGDWVRFCGEPALIVSCPAGVVAEILTTSGRRVREVEVATLTPMAATLADIGAMISRIDYLLEPEIIAADGERSRSQQDALRRFYQTARSLLGFQ